MEGLTDEPGNACARCGKDDMRLIAGRVGKLKEPGHIDIFQCSACGQFDHRDIPHQAPGRRT